MPYSYMTCVFPEQVSSDAHWERFSHFRKRLFERTEAVESSGGGDHYFDAISTQPGSLQAFSRLAMQLFSYCHITAGRTISFRPKLCLFHGEAMWDPGAVWDALEDAAYDMMQQMPDGWMSCHSSDLSEVLAAEPALSEATAYKQEHITNVIGDVVALDCWDLLSRPKVQGRVLLGSSVVETPSGSSSEPIVKLISTIRDHPSFVSAVSPREMEEIVAELLNSQGYRAQLTAQTRDGGRDVILLAVSNESSPLPEQRYLVEIKHPSPGKPVGVGTVRSLVGVGPTDPSTGLVLVTTTRFTPDARRFASHEALRYRLALKDYGDLMEWIDAYCREGRQPSRIAATPGKQEKTE